MQFGPAELSALKIRRLAFELGLSDLRVQGALLARTLPHGTPNLAVCPCCGYPTIGARRYHDICCLCNWEDDGQDDADADNVRGGPNHDYSLTEARGNFVEYRTQYRPSDVRGFARATPTYEARTALIAAFDALLPAVHPWEFIAAMPEIERLDRSIYEIQFGKREGERALDPAAEKLRGEYRAWDAWATLAAKSLAPWRRGWTQPPPARRAKDHALAALVNAISSRLRSLDEGRDVVMPERLDFFYGVTEWVRGEQSATLCRYDGDGKVGLTLWPDPGYEHVRFYQLDDEEAVEDAVARLAGHFA
jgi:cysteine-rich CPCC protein